MRETRNRRSGLVSLRYDLAEFLDLAGRLRPEMHGELHRACVVFMRGTLGLPFTGKQVHDLAAYGRTILQWHLDVRGLHEAHLKDTPHDRIGFVWQWRHPTRANTWTVVKVTDAMLCSLIGQDPDAYRDQQAHLWESARAYNESMDALEESPASSVPGGWAGA
ncbi:hypothetical protein [Deinococcus hohokamensis]|uniref:Uncharacterized protein n=1 Tax=Deinococcus hohokamensis TaxID=309883 RepID=A0ABV9I5Y0_9DEIO